MNEILLRVNNFDFRGSTCAGPGVRNVLFLQGCDRHCPGCHNTATWNMNGGSSMTVAQIMTLIEQNTPMRRITISGGEPLLQMKGLLVLSRELYRKGYDIAVYTGNTLADVPEELLETIHYIKVGDFQKSLKTSIKSYVGSTNQEFIKLHERN